MLQCTNRYPGCRPMIDRKTDFTPLEEYGMNTYQEILSLGKLNLSAWHRYTEQQMDLCGPLFKSGTQQLQRVTGGREISQLINGQLELSVKLSESALLTGLKMIDISAGTNDQCQTWLASVANTLCGKAAEPVK